MGDDPTRLQVDGNDMDLGVEDGNNGSPSGRKRGGGRPGQDGGLVGVVERERVDWRERKWEGVVGGEDLSDPVDFLDCEGIQWVVRTWFVLCLLKRKASLHTIVVIVVAVGVWGIETWVFWERKPESRDGEDGNHGNQKEAKVWRMSCHLLSGAYKSLSKTSKLFIFNQ